MCSLCLFVLVIFICNFSKILKLTIDFEYSAHIIKNVADVGYENWISRNSSVGRARDWKSLCPWFNSELRHIFLSLRSKDCSHSEFKLISTILFSMWIICEPLDMKHIIPYWHLFIIIILSVWIQFFNSLSSFLHIGVCISFSRCNSWMSELLLNSSNIGTWS